MAEKQLLGAVIEDTWILISSLLAKSRHLLNQPVSVNLLQQRKVPHRDLNSASILLIRLSFPSVLLSCHFLFFFKLSATVRSDWSPVL